MLRELAIDGKDLDAIGGALLSLRDSEDVLVVKQGGLKIPREEWIRLLENRFGLIADRRHFTPKWAADDAKRMEKELQEGRAAGGSTAAQIQEKERQMAPADWWEISYQPDKATSYAYSNTRQPLHCDNAWFADPAELNFFMMQKQAVEGGEGTFYRLSRLLEDLKKDDPALLGDRTPVKVPGKKGDEDFENHTEIIKLSPEPRIFWNYYRTKKDDKDVDRMCEAFFKYLEKQEATPSVERIRAVTGDCFCWHDQKMLHGRLSFKASRPKDRVVFQSMWRVPQQKAARAAA